MSMTIQDAEGVDVVVFARETGGRIEVYVRAASQALFEAAALARSMMVERTIEGVTTIEAAPGVEIAVIGPVGADTRYHANILISEPALSAETGGFANWKTTAILWTTQGLPDSAQNRNENAKLLLNVGLIDPDTISSPSLVRL